MNLAHQGSLSFITSRNLLKLMSIGQWCHPTITSSVKCFSSCPQSFPASGSKERKIICKCSEPQNKVNLAATEALSSLSRLLFNHCSKKEQGSDYKPFQESSFRSHSCACCSLCVGDQHFLLHTDHLLRPCLISSLWSFSWSCPPLSHRMLGPSSFLLYVCCDWCPLASAYTN